MIRLVPLQEALSLPCEDTVIRWPSASQEESSPATESASTLIMDLPTSGTVRQMSCCLSYPTCDILLWQPEQTHRSPSSSCSFLFSFFSYLLFSLDGSSRKTSSGSPQNPVYTSITTSITPCCNCIVMCLPNGRSY